jgi:hypothetical protein
MASEADRLAPADLRTIIVPGDFRNIRSITTNELPEGARAIIQAGLSEWIFTRRLTPDPLAIIPATGYNAQDTVAQMPNGDGLWVQYPQRVTATLVGGTVTIPDLYLFGGSQGGPPNVRVIITRRTASTAPGELWRTIDSSTQLTIHSSSAGDDATLGILVYPYMAGQ